MLKSVLTAAAAACLLSVAACGQGPAEKAGQAADTAYEQSTTGTTNPTDGPAENAGEAIDNGAMAPATTTTTTTSTAPTP
jgi:predicted small lipoprotein YifL